MASYMFGRTATNPGRQVDNTLSSAFIFRDGLIVEHHDLCHVMAWAVQAIVFPSASSSAGLHHCDAAWPRGASKNSLKATSRN